MNDTTIDDCHIFDIRKYSDNRRILSAVEGGIDLPFEKNGFITCTWYHKLRMEPMLTNNWSNLWATSSSVHITIDDGRNKKTFVPDKPWKGLCLAPWLWRYLDNFSCGAVCMVLASDRYNADDYIREYKEFKHYKSIWFINLKIVELIFLRTQMCIIRFRFFARNVTGCNRIWWKMACNR